MRLHLDVAALPARGCEDSRLYPFPQTPMRKSDLDARLAAFRRMRDEAAENGVTMLPVERIADDLFFRDDRLQEYRNVDNHNDRFAFAEKE